MRKNSVLIGGGLGYCYKRWMSSSSSEGRKRSAAVWGNGDYGRLGYGNLDSMWRPKLMNSSSFHNSNLKSISCGGAHTLFLTGPLSLSFYISHLTWIVKFFLVLELCYWFLWYLEIIQNWILIFLLEKWVKLNSINFNVFSFFFLIQFCSFI
jgi:hypothetical protein